MNPYQNYFIIAAIVVPFLYLGLTRKVRRSLFEAAVIWLVLATLMAILGVLDNVSHQNRDLR